MKLPIDETEKHIDTEVVGILYISEKLFRSLNWIVHLLDVSNNLDSCIHMFTFSFMCS